MKHACTSEWLIKSIVIFRPCSRNQSLSCKDICMYVMLLGFTLFRWTSAYFSMHRYQYIIPLFQEVLICLIIAWKWIKKRRDGWKQCIMSTLMFNSPTSIITFQFSMYFTLPITPNKISCYFSSKRKCCGLVASLVLREDQRLVRLQQIFFFW